jgi:hypothetical protein
MTPIPPVAGAKSKTKLRSKRRSGQVGLRRVGHDDLGIGHACLLDSEVPRQRCIRGIEAPEQEAPGSLYAGHWYGSRRQDQVQGAGAMADIERARHFERPEEIGQAMKVGAHIPPLKSRPDPL